MLSCRQAGIGLRLRLPHLTDGVRQTLRIMGPGVLGAGVTQLNLLISTALASLLPGGSVSYLYYADRLNQLPLGVVGIAVGTAILPPLSRAVSGGDTEGAIATQNRGLELALLLTLPAATALAILALPILAVLFERGAFGPVEASATASALIAYAVGLPAFVLVKVLAPAFFARHDTKTPVKVAMVSLATNLLLTIVLMQFFAHVGVAAALSVAGWLQAALLMVLLARRSHFHIDARARANLPRIALATLGMGGALVGLRVGLAPALNGGGATMRLAALATLVVGGLVVFLALILALGIVRWRDLRRLPA
jgi:putative peptidoglycan lipid II flippase